MKPGEIWKHADGGFYRIVDPDVALKDPATGNWVDAVVYMRHDGHGRRCCTTQARWGERFTFHDKGTP